MTSPSPSPAAPTRPRRVGLAIGLAGLIAALAFGILGAKMTFGAPLVVLALGGLVLALCALSLYRVIDPLLRAEVLPPDFLQRPGRIKELERDKQLVLKAIRELEHDYQMRKISDDDYKEQTQRYRTRAMRILREIDAGDDMRSLIEQELKTRLTAEATNRPTPEATS